MSIKVKFNNDDSLNFYSKTWLKVLLLFAGSIFLILALVQIFCLIVKPTGGQKIIEICGNKYIQQLIIGILLIGAYVLILKSKPTKK